MCLLTLTSFWALLVLATNGAGWDWKRPLSVQGEFNKSKCVFAGKVVKAKNIVPPRDEHFIQRTFYTIRVEEVLKGSPSKEVESYDENSSGRFPMKGGMSYLVFAYEGVFEGVDGPRLAVKSCGNSAALQKAAKTLATIRKLKYSGPRIQMQPIPP